MRSNLQRFHELILSVGSALAICLCLIQCWIIFDSLHGRATQTDFSIYYLTAKAVATHHNPYTADFASSSKQLGYNTGGVAHATDPPTFVVMLAPLAWLPIDLAFWVWSMFSAICFIVFICLLFGPGSHVSQRLRWVLIAMMVCYPATSSDLVFAQSKLQILMLLALMLSLIQVRRDGAAGFAFALAILLRVFPLAMIGYIVLQRRWRLLLFTAAGCTVGAFFTLLVLGSAETLSFTRGIEALNDQRWAAFPQDLAPSALVSRVFWALIPAGGSRLMDCLRSATVVCGRVALGWLTVRTTLSLTAAQDRDWRLFSLWVVTSILMSPILWLHDGVVFLILFAQLAVAASNGRASRRAITMALANWLFALTFTLWGAQYSIHARMWWQHIVAEFGSLSMLAAYVSAYWFVVDDQAFSAIRMRDVPMEILARLRRTSVSEFRAFSDGSHHQRGEKKAR